MENVYIDVREICESFKNLFDKDLVSINDLIDKIEELVEEKTELEEKLEKYENPDDNDDYYYEKRKEEE